MLVVPVMCKVRAIVLLLLFIEVVLELAVCSSLRGRISPSSATPPPPAAVKVATPPRLCMDAPVLLCEGVIVAKDTDGRGPVVWRVCLVGEDLQQHVHIWVKTCVRFVHIGIAMCTQTCRN